MRGTFDVFIDSPRFCSTPPESTQFVEPLWRRREPLPGALPMVATDTRSWHNDTGMANATITVDAALKERLAALAGQAGQRVDEFVEALLRRIADADVRFERGVPVFPRRHGAPPLSTEDVSRLADGSPE